MKAPNKIYLNVSKEYAETSDALEVATWDTKEWEDCVNIQYLDKELVLEKLRLAWGTISKDPYECNNVFEDLINELKSL